LLAETIISASLYFLQAKGRLKVVAAFHGCNEPRTQNETYAVGTNGINFANVQSFDYYQNKEIHTTEVVSRHRALGGRRKKNNFIPMINAVCVVPLT
jgi:hypothetical protein